MSESLRERIGLLVRRCGWGGVHRYILGACVLVMVAFVAFGVARWCGANADVHLEPVDPDIGTSLPAMLPRSDCTSSSVETETVTVFTVHVVGAVLRPGVYELDAGLRVADAVSSAGGLLGEAAQEGINLARPLVDGEQVRVPTSDELEAYLAGDTDQVNMVIGNESGPYIGAGVLTGSTERAVPDRADGDAAGGGSALIDVNHASTVELETLPGIGPSIATAIVRDREENGPFEVVEDLLRVSGIGEARLADIVDLVTVG